MGAKERAEALLPSSAEGGAVAMQPPARVLSEGARRDAAVADVGAGRGARSGSARIFARFVKPKAALRGKVRC
jgi:hypothetical protein